MISLEKTLQNLNEIEALILISRWAKLPNYFYYDDQTLLDGLKERKILEWVTSGQARMTRVIMRESPTYTAINEVVKNHGYGIEWLDYLSCNWRESLSASPNYNHYQILWNLYNGDCVKPKDNEIYAAELLEYEQKHKEYLEENKEYLIKLSERNKIKAEYDNSLRIYQSSMFMKFKEYLKTLDDLSGEEKYFLTWDCQNLSKKQKKRANKCIAARKFKYDSLPPPQVQLENLKVPKEPKKPDEEEAVELEAYNYGDIPEIDEAIDWVREFDPDFDYNDFDDHYLCDRLEIIIADEAFEIYQSKALDIFSQMLEGEIDDPKNIYEALTELPINYEKICGMPNVTDRFLHETLHEEFGKWHQINLSETGLWLIEIEPVSEPEMKLYLPFDALKYKLPDVFSVPYEFSAMEYEKEISEDEQEQYPIRELVEIFGMSISDFPHRFWKYETPYRYQYNYDYYNRYYDDDDDWDEDEEKYFL